MLTRLFERSPPNSTFSTFSRVGILFGLTHRTTLHSTRPRLASPRRSTKKKGRPLALLPEIHFLFESNPHRNTKSRVCIHIFFASIQNSLTPIRVHFLNSIQTRNFPSGLSGRLARNSASPVQLCQPSKMARPQKWPRKMQDHKFVPPVCSAGRAMRHPTTPTRTS